MLNKKGFQDRRSPFFTPTPANQRFFDLRVFNFYE